MNTIELIIQILTDLGYTPELKKVSTYYDISFPSFGCDAFPIKHKNVVRSIAVEKLMEFYYQGCSTQHIYIRGN